MKWSVQQAMFDYQRIYIYTYSRMGTIRPKLDDFNVSFERGVQQKWRLERKRERFFSNKNHGTWQNWECFEIDLQKKMARASQSLETGIEPTEMV